MTTPPPLSQTLADEIIRLCRRARRPIEADIVLGRLTAIVSMLSGIAKLDGVVLQKALFEALSRHPDFEVLLRPRIPIPDGAKFLATIDDHATWLGAALPFSGQKTSTVEVDFIVINRVTRVATAFECKRGGMCDFGKRRKIVDNLIRVRMVLAAYLRQLRLAEPTRVQTEVQSAEVGLIVYYGKWSLKPIPTLTRHTIDEHFGIPVTPVVAAAAELMRREMTSNLMPVLSDLLEALVAQSADPEMAPGRADLAKLLTRALGLLQPVEEAK